MDPLLLEDIEGGWANGSDEKLALEEEPVETGFRLKSAELRKAVCEASEAEIDDAIERWLRADD